jgi:hypothetical protein
VNFFLDFLDWSASEIEKLKSLERVFKSVRTRESLYLTITSFTMIKDTNFQRKMFLEIISVSSVRPLKSLFFTQKRRFSL